MSLFLAIYTIADFGVLNAALDNDGLGQLREGRPWARAREWLESNASENLMLLLGNASLVNGVEWVAKIDRVTITNGETICTFSGLQRLVRRIPLTRLRKASDNEPLNANYIRPYVPCIIDQRLANQVMEALKRNRGASLSRKQVPTSNARHGEVPLRNFVQYNNNEKVGAVRKGSQRSSIFSSKSISKLLGQRVWLISGEGKTKKSFHLEYTFLVDQIQAGEPNVASGTNGIEFDPPVLLSGLEWFEAFKVRQQNFSLGLREIDEQAVAHLEQLIRGRTLLRQRIEEIGAAAEVGADPQCRDLRPTEREALVQARIGQGKYRSNLIELWEGRCAVTGCDLDAVLVASHAKPWASSSNEERLDPFNGFLFIASIDKLFDAGFVTFEDDGAIVVSEQLSDQQLAVMGLTRSTRLRYVHARHIAYIRAHREMIFRG